jgi:hypothetical protein
MMGLVGKADRSSARLRRGARAYHQSVGNALSGASERRDRRDRKRSGPDSALSHNPSRPSCLLRMAASPLGGARSTGQGRGVIAWKLVDGVGRSPNPELDDPAVTGHGSYEEL